MFRLSALAFLPVCLVIPAAAISGPTIKEVEIDGVRLQYVEQGSGEPIVFVHGAFSDLRIWEPVREQVAQNYRYIAYTQRYFGTKPWPDDGKQFSVATDAGDLAQFISALDLRPVHLVTRSRGGAVAVAALLKDPSLARSLTLHEPGLFSMIPDTAEGKLARANRGKFVAPAASMAKSGDAAQAVRLFFEGEYQLGPNGFDRLPEATREMLLDNARTAPLLFGSAPPPPVTCEMLKSLKLPTLVTHGEKTHAHSKLISDAVSRCLPGARQVSFPNFAHDAPSRDPAAFVAAVFEFLSRF